MKKFEFIKIYLSFLVLMFSCTGMFSQNKILDTFYELDSLKSAFLNYQQAVYNSENLIRYYVPKGVLQSSGSYSIDLNDNLKGYNENCAMNLSQLFPGYTTLNWVLAGEINGIISGYENPSPLNYYFEPEISLSIPLIFAKGGTGCLDEYGRRYAPVSKKIADLNYKINLCSAKKEYIDAVGKFLYLRELLDLYKVQSKLVYNRLCDSEELFRLGKINYLSLAEENTKYSELQKYLLELKSDLIESEQLMASLGIETTDCDFSMKEFVAVWKTHFDLMEQKILPVFYSEEKEIASVLLNSYYKVDDLISSIPYLSASASLNSKEVSEGFPDFYNGTWKFSLVVNIPVNFGSRYTCGKQLGNIRKNMELEKNRVIRGCKNYKKKKYAALEMYKSYCSSLEEKLQLERKRLQVMECLVKAGTIAQWDMTYQENFTNIQELELLNGELNVVSLRADFY